MELSSLVIAMPGKGNPLLSVRIPPELDSLIDAEAEQTGETRSEVAIAALSAYLQPSVVEDDVSDLRRRVERLERQLPVDKPVFGKLKD